MGGEDELRKGALGFGSRITKYVGIREWLVAVVQLLSCV